MDVEASEPVFQLVSAGLTRRLRFGCCGAPFATSAWPDKWPRIRTATSALQEPARCDSSSYLGSCDSQAICAAHGSPEPLAEQFLVDLNAKLQATAGQVHEPFGRV